MKNKFLCIHFAYQPTKNMKYLGPKGSISTKIKNKTRPIVMHSVEHIDNNIKDYETHHHIVVGFESEKVLKNIDNMSVGYSIVVDYKNTNHGKILKDNLLKYDYSKYDGCLITSDIGFLLQSEVNINPDKNYIFYTNSDSIETENTCNLDGDNIEYITYKTNSNYWTGMCFFSNEIIRLIKHLNLIYYTDPLFLMEIINKSISCGAKFDGYKLTNKDFTYISNNSLKKMKAV